MSTFRRPIAHRGLHNKEDGIIENSKSAFEAAIVRGFGIECDLQLTRDGEAVVFHDDSLERLTGQTGPVSEVSPDSLVKTPLLDSSAADCPQRFGALLAQVAGKVPLVVEVKRQADPQATTTLAQQAVDVTDGYEGDVVFKSFDPEMLVALRRAGCSYPMGIITKNYAPSEAGSHISARDRFVLRHLLHYPWTRFTFISCEHTALTMPAVRLFRAVGLKVTSWTITSQDQAHDALRHADQIVFEGFDPDA